MTPRRAHPSQSGSTRIPHALHLERLRAGAGAGADAGVGADAANRLTYQEA